MSLLEFYKREMNELRIARELRERESARRKQELIQRAQTAAQRVYQSLRTLDGRKGIQVNVTLDHEALGGKTLQILTGQHVVSLNLFAGPDNEGVIGWRISQGQVIDSDAGGSLPLKEVERKFDSVFGNWFKPYLLRVLTEEDVLDAT